MKNDNRMIFADEMFSAFNKLYNEYCKKQKCYYVKQLFVRKERLLNSPFALVVCFVKIILLLFIFSLGTFVKSGKIAPLFLLLLVQNWFI